MRSSGRPCGPKTRPEKTSTDVDDDATFGPQVLPGPPGPRRSHVGETTVHVTSWLPDLELFSKMVGDRRLGSHGAAFQIPNLLHLSCHEWYDVMSITRLMIGVLVTLFGGLVTWLLVALLDRALRHAHGRIHFDAHSWNHFLRGRPWLVGSFGFFWVAGLVVSITLGVFVSTRTIPPQLVDWHLFWPKSPECSFHWVTCPEPFPLHAGAGLTTHQQQQRLEFFVSLLLWLVLAAFLAGELLTCLGNACRGCLTTAASQYVRLHSASSWISSPSSSSCCSSSSITIHPNNINITLGIQIAMHSFCATLTALALALKGLDAHQGVWWEVYVCWTFVMLTCSILHASYFALTLPAESYVPHFGLPVITAVVPILSEPLDTFKDWIFVGIAVSRGTCSSLLVACLGLLILFSSNVYMSRCHLQELERCLMPVQAVLSPEGRGRCSFLVKQTSPAKLAIALTEDLPQAILQSIFVILYGGSSTQLAFITLSAVKIVVCFSLHAVFLEMDGRHGESWTARVRYFEVQIAIWSLLLGQGNRWVLALQRGLAEAWYDLGEQDKALQLKEEVLESSRFALGPHDCDTLEAEKQLAVTLRRIEKYTEALALFDEVMKAEQEMLNPRHPQVLMTRSNFAVTLGKLERHEEASMMLEGVLAAEREVLGDMHFETLWTQRNYAESLNKLKRHEDALRELENVFAAQREMLGMDHPNTLRTASKLARTLHELGRDEEALQRLEQVLQGCQEAFGPQHEFTLEMQREVQDLRCQNSGVAAPDMA